MNLRWWSGGTVLREAGFNADVELTCYGKDRAPYFLKMNFDSFAIAPWEWTEWLWLPFALMPAHVGIMEAIP